MTRRLSGGGAAAFVSAAIVLNAAVGVPPAGGDVPTILVSRQLMEAERLTIGEMVRLSPESTGAVATDFRIVGQYEPTPDPMRLGVARHEVRLHLPDLIRMTADPSDPLTRESVDAINVAGPSTGAGGDPARAIARALAAQPGTLIEATRGDDARSATFVVLDRFHLAIAVVTVFASSLFLLALMLMLVDERRALVGILRLIGFTRQRVVLYVFAEGAVLAATGAVFGVGLSAVFEGAINRFFQWRYDTALVFVHITPAIALRSMAVAVPLGVAAAVASSWGLLRRDALALLRR